MPLNNKLKGIINFIINVIGMNVIGSIGFFLSSKYYNKSYLRIKLTINYKQIIIINNT